MIEKLNITWNNDWSNDGFLYFGQRIVEMLDYMTVDIYRAPLLNTTRLIDEYLDIYNKTKNPSQLQFVKEEFLFSFEEDVVLDYIYDREKILHLVATIKSSTDPVGVFNYLKTTIGRNYFNWCKEYICYIIWKNKEKKKIESAIRCFVPELLRYGYYRDEVYHNAKKILLAEDIDPHEALEEFFDLYNREMQIYTVYFLFNRKMLQFQKLLEDHLHLDFSLDERAQKINVDNQYIVVKLNNVKAMDFSGAANSAMGNIELFLDFFQFLGNYDYNFVHNKVWVYNTKNEEKRIVVNREKYKSIEYESHSTIGKLTEEIITCLITSARCSISRLREIIKVHNRAISNNGLENGFLNLWSILEMICVTDLEGKKGDQVKKKLIPILQKDYMVTIFEDISDNLVRVLPTKTYEDLLQTIEEDASSSYEKIAIFLLLNKYEQQVDDFVDDLVNYPVIRTRILDIRDNYHKRSKLYNASTKYAQRISWHLSRIYRVRNGIIHSGKTPNDIKDLGEHLHEYVDHILNELLIQLSKGSLCNISNVLIDSQFRRESLFKILDSTEPFSVDNIKQIFDSALYYEP